jgi:hypothetical protein
MQPRFPLVYKDVLLGDYIADPVVGHAVVGSSNP